jgi:oligoribonuclease (3'-5' exoribonuclease)
LSSTAAAPQRGMEIDMYMTDSELLQLAEANWSLAQIELDKLGKKMDRLGKQAEKTNGLQYEMILAEVEVIRIQYAALAPEVNQRWDRFQGMRVAQCCAKYNN